MLLTQLVEENIKNYGEYPLLYFDGNEISNVEVQKNVQEIAYMLRHLGIEKGDRVIVCMPNNPEVMLGYQGIWNAGAVVLPTMYQLHSREIHYIATDSEAKAIITSSEMLPKIIEATKDMDQKPMLLVVNESEDHKYTTNADDLQIYDFYNELNKHRGQTAPEQDLNDKDLSVILYTAGTTGKPKGVMLTHKNLYSVASIGTYVKEDWERETTISVLPLSHSFGLTLANRPLLLGDSIVLLPKFDVAEMCKAIEKHQVKNLTLVPAMIQQMVYSPETEKFDLSCLEAVTSGSASLPVQVSKKFREKFNADVLEGYGLSEAAPIVSATIKGMPVKPGSAGVPLPGVNVRIANENGEALPTGEVGELLVSGDNIMTGYYNDSEASDNALVDGWLHTGDMARLDEEGYLFIVDRKKDLIIRGGFNIYPRDLEELIMSYEGVAEVAVFGVPSETMGEEVIAVVAPESGVALTESGLITYCQEHLAKYKTPRKVVLVEELPRNGVGKIQKNRAKEMVSEQKLFHD